MEEVRESLWRNSQGEIETNGEILREERRKVKELIEMAEDMNPAVHCTEGHGDEFLTIVADLNRVLMHENLDDAKHSDACGQLKDKVCSEGKEPDALEMLKECIYPLVGPLYNLMDEFGMKNTSAIQLEEYQERRNIKR